MAYERAEIEALVRQVVSRTLGDTPTAVRGAAQRPLIDETAVREMPPGSTQILPPNAIVTPLARQLAVERHIRFLDAATAVAEPTSATPFQHTSGKGDKTVALGADHGGYALKAQIKAALEPDYRVIDCGTHGTEAVDYPDYAYAVARLVADGQAWRGIVIDGAGIGSCMTANKVPGVRAAMCYDQATAVNSREHNNANVLTLGAGLIGPNLAQQIVRTWLATEFGGGRHARRVDKIDQLDRRYGRDSG